ncbi:MAG: circularly permuted type 2 ATP-grasp protein [Planctomycetota bacterium]
MDAKSPLSLTTYPISSEQFDACLSNTQDIRPGWAPLNEWVKSVGASGLSACEKQLQRLIRDNGATFTVEEDQEQQVRPWKLAPLPMVIDADAWTPLERGLQQRTRLLEAVLSDLLGDQTLIRDGVVPPDLLWANPAFARDFVGLPVATDSQDRRQRLEITGTDLTRTSRGQWLVVGDRTRAPSGLGYLLENRITTSQVHSQLVRQCNVRRVARFFLKLRSRLQDLAPRMRGNPRIALLTPGPKSYRYFEDAYLARYLGFTLVQGSDLAVRGERLNLKTLGGLLPVEVLWRHVSDRKCDPLELDPTSREGVTGLLRTVRDQSVSIVNAIGSELAQMPALAPFLPAAAKHFWGEELDLPNAETYWCGNEQKLSHVLANFEEFLLRDAFVVDRESPIDVRALPLDQQAYWRARLSENPQSFVAQRREQGWTTPVWEGEQVTTWNVSLRTFQVAAGEDVDVLPGGLARVGPTQDCLLGSPVSGHLTVDCWIADDCPTSGAITLLPAPDAAIEPQRGGDDLPSRVAEHLFWLGRYLERSEAIARLLRTTLKCLVGEEFELGQSSLPRLTAALASIGQLPPDCVIEGLGEAYPSLESMLPASVFSKDQPGSLQQALRSMVYNASAVRDRLSIDGYRILRQTAEELNSPPPVSGGVLGPALERLNQLITDLLAFSGLTSESMTRTYGWRFLQLGRRIERTHQTVELLSASLVPVSEPERLICEAVLESTDSVMTYHARYMNLVRPQLVLDLLVCDDTNPRSILYQLKRIDDAISRLPRAPAPASAGPDEDQESSRLLIEHLGQVNLDALDAAMNGRREALSQLLQFIGSGLPDLSDAIAAQFFFHTNPSQALTGASGDEFVI